jgi:hypothetical protein
MEYAKRIEYFVSTSAIISWQLRDIGRRLKTVTNHFWGFHGREVSSRSGLWRRAVFVVGYHRFRGPCCPRDGGSMDLWNDGILPQHYTAPQPRRNVLEPIPPRQRIKLKHWHEFSYKFQWIFRCFFCTVCHDPPVWTLFLNVCHLSQ